MKKSKVSWPSDRKLCQVKTFLKEDCPAKVSTQSSTKPKAMNFPPGFEATQYSTRHNIISLRPKIKWNCPPKFIFNDTLVLPSGEESTETVSENSRTSKVMEAFYPHRSSIPLSPAVSPSVENERYDDSKTPKISLITINDELDASVVEASHNSKPDMSLVATALMKTKEQGSLVDPDLLVKFLSDPQIVMKLMNGIKNNTENINKHSFVPQHVTSSATNPNHIASVAVQSSVSVAPHPPQAVSSALSINPCLQKAPSLVSAASKPLPSPRDSYIQPGPVNDVVPKPQSQSKSNSILSIGDMNRVPESMKKGRDSQILNGACPININRDAQDEVSLKAVKSVEYCKNLIREYGVANPATNETGNYEEIAENNVKLVKAKIQKPCRFFGRGKGCKNGENCLYLHDSNKRAWTIVAAQFPTAKRLKYAT